MSDHYYSNKPETLSHEQEISIEFRDRRYRFITDHSVFSKTRFDHGSRILLETVMDELEGPVLDFGCGYGPIGILISDQTGLDVSLSDINERAIHLTRKNALLNHREVKALLSDGFSSIEGSFSSILMNPPIRIGKERIYSFFKEAKDYLTEGGALYIVIQKKQGAKSALAFLEEIYPEVITLNRQSGYHVFRCR